MGTSLRAMVVAALLVGAAATPAVAAGAQGWQDHYWSPQTRADFQRQVRDALREARSAVREARREAQREAWHARREALRDAARIRRDVYRSLDRHYWHGHDHDHWRY
ncbi:MAG TPA: hypothetical protein VF219_15810 [Vicinamibacterales bacterium]